MKFSHAFSLFSALLAALALSCGGGNGAAYSGVVQMRQWDLQSEVAGRLVELKPLEGDTVRAGDELGRLDPADFEAALRRAEAEAARAEAQYKNLLAGSRREEIQAAEAKLSAAEAAAGLAEKEWERLGGLAKMDFASPSDLDRARAERDRAVGERDAAREAFRLAVRGFRAEEILAAREGFNAARESQELARRNLAKTRFTSPRAGIALKRIREPGEVVQPGMSILVLVDPGERWVETWVPEKNVPKIHSGDAVSLHADAWPGETFAGKIAQISPTAEFIPAAVHSREERADLSFRVRILFDDPAGRLRAGLPVDVRFQLHD